MSSKWSCCRAAPYIAVSISRMEYSIEGASLWMWPFHCVRNSTYLARPAERSTVLRPAASTCAIAWSSLRSHRATSGESGACGLNDRSDKKFFSKRSKQQQRSVPKLIECAQLLDCPVPIALGRTHNRDRIKQHQSGERQRIERLLEAHVKQHRVEVVSLLRGRHFSGEFPKH